MTSFEAELEQVGLDAGLSTIGFATAEPLVDTRDILVERKAEGLHDGMQFTYRNPDRSTTPQATLDTAASLIVAARAYAAPDLRDQSSDAQSDADAARPRAAIAAYAWRDHYRDLRDGLEAMAEVLRSRGHTARVVADDNALVDRAAAERAGLGWFGKNSNLLLPGAGSWFVLGSVMTDAALTPSDPVAPACGACRRCLDGCPTGAIVAPGVIDAGRCLAWLLQKTGDFPQEYRAALGNRIYGCDDCQEVCPPNRQAAASAVGDEVTHVDIISLLEASDAEIEQRHGRWYIPKREMSYVRRNALVALGNELARNGAPVALVTGVVTACLRSEDGMVRRHAAWAAGRSGDRTLCDLVAAIADDATAEIAQELTAEMAAGATA